MHIFHCLIIIQILIEPVLPLKQAEHMLVLFLFFIIYIYYYQKYVFNVLSSGAPVL